MDDQRFDAWTRAFGVLTDYSTRRAGLRLLAAGGLASLLSQLPNPGTAAKTKHANRKRKHHKKKRHAPPDPYPRCVAPAATAFVAAVDRCAPQCGDTSAAACRSCREPDVAAAVAAVTACASENCRCEFEVAAEDSGPRRERSVRTEATGCDSSALSTCLKRNTQDLAVCLFAAGNARETIACFTQDQLTFRRCKEDLGCPNGGHCKSPNTCCPRPLDTVCNGACCDTERCERCVGGVCKGCKSPAGCGQTPLGTRVCQCPSIAFTICGNTCCDSRAPTCETCVDGVCQPKCKAPRICVGELFPTCECPSGGGGVGETCAVNADCCPDDLVCRQGVCAKNPCLTNQVHTQTCNTPGPNSTYSHCCMPGDQCCPPGSGPGAGSGACCDPALSHCVNGGCVGGA
jgi:hypothetical protein